MMIPFGTYRNAMRQGVAAALAKAGTMASSSGRARAVPPPRSSARLDNGLLRCMLLSGGSSHLEGPATDNLHHQRGKAIVVRRHLARDLVHSRPVVRLESPPQRIGEQLLGEVTVEGAGVPSQDLPQA